MLQSYDLIRPMLENIIFDDSVARYNSYQAKNAIQKIQQQLSDKFGEVTAVSSFVIEKIKENTTYEFTTRQVHKKHDMFLCLKNSLFLKDLNLREQSE